MTELETIYRETPPEQRFGNPRLLAAIRAAEAEAEREAERERRAQMAHLCLDCDGEGVRKETCSECDGEGEVEVECEHESVELPEEAEETITTPA